MHLGVSGLFAYAGDALVWGGVCLFVAGDEESGAHIFFDFRQILLLHRAGFNGIILKSIKTGLGCF